MSYQEILQWMFSKLPMYQRKGAAAYRPGRPLFRAWMQSVRAPGHVPLRPRDCRRVAGVA